MQSMSCGLREGTEYRPSGRYYTLHQAVDCMLVDNWWYTPVHDTVLVTQPCYIHQPEMWLQILCVSTKRGLSTRLDAVSYPYIDSMTTCTCTWRRQSIVCYARLKPLFHRRLIS